MKKTTVKWVEYRREPIGLKWSSETTAHKVPVFWMMYLICEQRGKDFRERVETGPPVYPIDTPNLWTAFKVFSIVAPDLEKAALALGSRGVSNK
jgi:hypothetical protein